jgi:hypothetical protein
MAKVRLAEIAMARSGDKGADSNVGIWVRTDEHWRAIERELTPERVKAHFGPLCRGEVVRYELPKLRALNFILEDSLDGGASASLRVDAQGKTYGNGLLWMEVELGDDVG